MDRFHAKVFDLSQDGLGVVKSPEGVVFFVAGAWPGDEGEFEIIQRKKKNYGYARIVALTVSSPDRIVAPCPYHGFGEGKCGGCSWQFVNYKAQVIWKEKLLNQALKRSGFSRFQGRIESIVESPKALGYRNRVSMKTDGENVGFLAFNSHELVPVDDCLVLNDNNRSKLRSIVEQLPHENWVPELGRKWKALEFDDQTELGALRADAPMVFRQANDEQNSNMKNWLAEEIDSLPLESNVLELFCGSGNFSEVFHSKGFQDFVGIEINQVAMEAAAKKFQKYRFHALNLFEKNAWSRLLPELKEVDILLLDPPREGFPQLPDLMAELPCLQIIYYVSCNYSTFFRDMAPCTSGKWRLERLQPFDLFPQTPHLEVIGKFVLNEESPLTT